MIITTRVVQLGGILCVENKKLGCGIESIDPITEILTPFFLRYGAKTFLSIFPHSSIIVKNKQRTHNRVNVDSVNTFRDIP
jgi:hypothetical protein